MDYTKITPPAGLNATTSDKLARLAALITASTDQPFAAKWTNKVLPAHAAARKQTPLPVDEVPPPTPQDSVSLREPI